MDLDHTFCRLVIDVDLVVRPHPTFGYDSFDIRHLQLPVVPRYVVISYVVACCDIVTLLVAGSSQPDCCWTLLPLPHVPHLIVVTVLTPIITLPVVDYGALIVLI